MSDKNGKIKKQLKNAAISGMTAGSVKSIVPVSKIKSNPNFATPGTQFKATKPGTSNQQSSTSQGIGNYVKKRSVKALSDVVKGISGAPSYLKDISSAITGASAAGMAKGPIYMMYGKKAAPMMGGSPLAKYGCSKKL
tara:strand:+ start:49 stop:462 length:414 start_codon:yes stop_codon:yes gene_type:complete